MKRLLNPKTNSTGLVGTASGLYGIAQALWNALHLHTATISPTVIYAFLVMAASVYQWMRNTPVADPRDGNGKPLLTAYDQAAASFEDALKQAGGKIIPWAELNPCSRCNGSGSEPASEPASEEPLQ